MQIELIGCTSAGKTTLARKMVQAGEALGIDAQLSDNLILTCARLNWIENAFLRRRVIELWALLTCLVFWRKYSELYRLIVHTCLLAPGSWSYKTKLARVALQKIGISEILRSQSSDRQVILVDDEGVLQASHTLFAHLGGPPSAGGLSAFLSLAPLPDVIVYVRQPEPVLIERTRKRGHNRIPRGSNDKDVEIFIGRAVAVFEELQQHPRLADRLLVLCGKLNTLVTREHHNNPLLLKAAKLLLAGARVATPADNEVGVDA